MKIWQRIFLTTIAIVITSVMGIGLYLLDNQFVMQRERETKYAINLHEEIINIIKSEIELYKSENETEYTDDIAFRNIITKVVKQRSGSDYYISVTIDNKNSLLNRYIREGVYTEYELDYGETKYETKVINGDYYFMTGSKSQVYGRDLYIFLSRNVSEIYQMHETQVEELISAGGALSLFAAFLLIILVKISLKPIKKLQEGIHDIADGNYGETLVIKGHNELTELTKDVNHMSNKIAENMYDMEEMVKNRTDFIGNMAHEMKTPLTAILGFADILTINPKLNREQVVEYSEYIYREAQRLRGMSGKLLELVQLRENVVKSEVINIGEVLNEVMLTEYIIFEKENMSLESTIIDDVYVVGDKDLLKSLFYNIIDNAKKATSAGGKVTVEMTEGDNEVYIKITDYGIGIPEAELKKITEPFYMVDKSRTRKHGGAGLGLALCKKIVELTKGTMNIISSEGKGCQVAFTFPKAKGGVE